MIQKNKFRLIYSFFEIYEISHFRDFSRIFLNFFEFILDLFRFI